MRIFSLSAIVWTGCLGATTYLNASENHSTLIFAKSVNASLERGYFVSTDGRDLKRWVSTLDIESGVRTVGYLCSVYTDGPPPATLTMTFEPRKEYVFRCDGEFHAAVQENSPQ